MTPYHPPFRNRLLSLLGPADLAAISPFLESVPLRVRQDLELPNGELGYAYFPEDGIISVVARMPGGGDIEVGIVGRDGMTGSAALLGDLKSTDRVFVQVAGHAHRIPIDDLMTALTDNERLRAVLLLYIRAFGLQVSSTALANGRSTIEVRLARWLLLCRDRLETDALELTHEFLAVMLGVRRAGVTIALQTLEGRHLINARRGVVRIRDRPGLTSLAGGAYGVPEAEYERLLGALDGKGSLRAERAAAGPQPAAPSRAA
jgi:CRP-like cAMP-binding protein